MAEGKVGVRDGRKPIAACQPLLAFASRTAALRGRRPRLAAGPRSQQPEPCSESRSNPSLSDPLSGMSQQPEPCGKCGRHTAVASSTLSISSHLAHYERFSAFRRCSACDHAGRYCYPPALQAFQPGPPLQRSQYLVNWFAPSRVGVGRLRGHCRLVARPSFEWNMSTRGP
jgi:hypothetical protein